MKKITLTIVLTVLASSLVFAGGQAQQSGLTKESGVLTVGADFTYRPMEYYNDANEMAGFDVDFAKALAAEMGLTVKFVDTAWDGIFAGLDRNDYDCIISSVTMSETRLEAFNFSHPYIANSLSLVMPDGTAQVASLDALAGKRVAYQIETTSDFYLTDYITKTGLKVEAYEYDGMMQCFDELKLGRVDAVLTDTLVAVDYVNDGFDIVWQGSDLGEFFGVCIKKGNTALTDAVNKALTTLFSNGKMVSISKDIFAGVDMVSEAYKAW
jgi:polar amino acid transport system substrate-binding protein